MRRRATIVLPGLVSLVLLSACGGEDAAQPAHAVRDSAGIEIVESRRPASTGEEAWRLSPRPEVEIGEADGAPEYTLSRVAGAVRLPDGRIAVADGGSNQIRFYDPSGTFLGAVGREGEGPGEYDYIRALKRCAADSLVVFDIDWTASIYDLSGELGRTLDLRYPGTNPRPYRLACSRHGRFAVTGWGDVRGRRGLFRTTTHVWVLDRLGEPVVDLGRFPGDERFSTGREGRPHPLGKWTVLAMGGGRVFVGTAERLKVRVYGLDGHLHRIMRAGGGAVPIEPADMERYREQRIAETDPEARQAMQRWLEEMPRPETFPAYRRLLLDPAGNLWVRGFQRPGRPDPGWSVFSDEGWLRGVVDVPSALRVTEVGRDYVLGVATDDLNVERVRLYGLIRGEGE